MVKDVSVVEILVASVLCVVPVAMGLFLVCVAVFQKSGTSDVQSWASEDDAERSPNTQYDGRRLHAEAASAFEMDGGPSTSRSERAAVDW